MDAYRVFFSLLASAIDGKAPDADIIGEITPEVLEKVYKLARAHDFAHVIGKALEGNRLGHSEETVAKLAKHQMVSMYRYGQLEYELGRICETLEKFQIPFVALKGSVIRNYYPEAYMRTSCDIDILVHEEELERAIDLLSRECSYRVEGEKGHHDISLFSESGVHLELHFTICETRENLDRLLSCVWDHVSAKEGSCRYEMEKEFLVFHIIAHAADHFISGGCGIKPVVDLWILNKYMEYDRELVAEYCRKCDLEKFYTSLLRLADIWFEDGEYDDVTAHMADYILGAGVYGKKENKIALNQSRTGNKLVYLWKRIFIPYDELKYYYVKLQDHKWLLPYYEVKRWCRLVFGGGMKSSVKEIKMGVNMSDEKSDYVASLMDKLEL